MITTNDLKGREIPMYALPGVGTKLVINGNEFRIIYKRETPRLTYTIEFVKRHEQARPS